MAEVARKGGKKNRKFGRHKTRSPAAARYRNENRSDKNSRRKMKKDERQQEKSFTLKVPHGAARALRRAGLQNGKFEGEGA